MPFVDFVTDGTGFRVWIDASPRGSCNELSSDLWFVFVLVSWHYPSRYVVSMCRVRGKA